MTKPLNPRWLRPLLGNPSCPLCATPLLDHHESVCAHCHAALPWHQTTGSRQQITPVFSLFDYADPIKQLILAGKTGKQLDKLHILAQLIAAHLPARLDELPEAILPIPLHHSRLHKRGFNQSTELVRPLAHALGIPLLHDYVVRHRDTGDQKSLRASERSHNLRNAFSLKKTIPFTHVALFDDVLTTGATCAELESILLDHDVKKIQIWTCARTKQ